MVSHPPVVRAVVKGAHVAHPTRLDNLFVGNLLFGLLTIDVKSHSQQVWD
ncbi:MAG: hypothetical protein V7K97_31015 [Nostoc sp.]